MLWLCGLKRKMCLRSAFGPAPFLSPSSPPAPPRLARTMATEKAVRHVSGTRPFSASGSHSSLTRPSSSVSPTGSRSPSPVSTHDILTLRALVSTKEAGVIIGKAGKNVAELREQARVKAGVSPLTPGVHERVLTVAGSVEAVAKVVDIPMLSPFVSLILAPQSRPTPTSSLSSSHQVHIPLPYHHHPLPTPPSAFSSLTT